MKPALTTVSVATMLGAGTATYAYASDQVLPDHPLYPVRQQVEQLEERLAFTPTRKATVRLKHVERRVHELERLAERRQVLQGGRQMRFSESFQQALEQGDSLPNGARARFDANLAELEHRRLKLLEETRETEINQHSEEEAEREIESAVDEVADRIEHLQERRRKKFDQILKRREEIRQKGKQHRLERKQRLEDVKRLEDQKRLENHRE